MYIIPSSTRGKVKLTNNKALIYSFLNSQETSDFPDSCLFVCLFLDWTTPTGSQFKHVAVGNGRIPYDSECSSRLLFYILSILSSQYLMQLYVQIVHMSFFNISSL